MAKTDKDSKKLLDKEALLKPDNHLNTTCKSETLGEVEIKFVSWRDLRNISRLLKDFEDGREFTFKLIHHQLVRPRIEYKRLKKLTEKEFKSIAKEFISNESGLFRYFPKTGKTDFFGEFREAIKKYIDEINTDQVFKTPPLLRSSAEMANALKRQYEAVLPRIIQMPAIDKYLMESTSQLTKQIRNFQDSAMDIFRPMIRQAKASADLMAKVIAPQIDLWTKWTDLNKSIFLNLNKQWNEFQAQYKISEKEAIRVLSKYNWLITPSIPISFVFTVVKIGKRKGNQRGAINRLFVDYFLSERCINLENLIEGWKDNDLFKHRIKIMRDCVSVIRNSDGKYNPSNLVLPVLIAQIDGIRIDFMDRNGLHFFSGAKKWKPLFEAKTSNEAVFDLANEFFLEILFQRSDYKKPLANPFSFNRHKIMHGENLYYGRIDNTIRAFLVLDFLAWLK